MNSFFLNKTNQVIIGIVVVVALVAGIFMMTNNSTMSDQIAMAGDRVFVNYTGTLENGAKFDSSYDNGAPIDFILGTGAVIKGWDEGIVGMQVGEKKKLVITPDKAYGAQQITDGQGNIVIPANATLTFDVELVSIER